MKKIAFGSKPTSPSGPATLDDWVADRPNRTTEPTKRLTIDVPVSLHQRIKVQCTLQGQNMADVLRAILEDQFRSESTPRAAEDRHDRPSR
jgi:hypothetical protein